MPRNLNPVFSARSKSIFPTMSALARKAGAINLGQGFPDEDGPREILDVAARAIIDGPNQYAPVEGVRELRVAIARDNKRFYDLDIDPDTQTLVVSGATEGLAAAFLGFLEPGDEAVIFAPFYECYGPQIEAAGAVVKVVDLAPPHWRVTAEALENAITMKTKVVVVNSPHNPLGKIVSRAELEIIADSVRRHDLIAICDEVYEHLIFDGTPHTPLMTLPDMRDRCIRIGSAGKTFSLTGWRIGYVSGPAHLITGVMKAHQFLAYTSPSHLQLAVAHGLGLGDDYYQAFKAGMQEKRDLMAAGLRAAGFDVSPCEGTYFITVDIRAVGADDDVIFCRDITENAKVAAVPLSAFFHPTSANVPKHFARFCFCKKPEVIEEACRRLKQYFA